MKLKNSTYDTLKWIALICLPAVQVFWLTIGKIWNIPYTIEIGATIGAVALLLGTLLGVSSYEHNKPFEIDMDDATYIDDEEIEVEKAEEV